MASVWSPRDPPDPILSDAREIVFGTFRPWDCDKGMASREDWRFAAQCALDGDDSDLRSMLAELDAIQSEPVLPDNEDWKHDRAMADAIPGEARAA